MARDIRHLECLVRGLAKLAPEERARVVSETALRVRRQPGRAKASVPILQGGTAWLVESFAARSSTATMVVDISLDLLGSRASDSRRPMLRYR